MDSDSTAQPNQIGISDWLWVDSNRPLRILDLQIPSPMVYVTDSRTVNGCAEPAAIDFALHVSTRSSNEEDGRLGYCPQYGQLTAQQRRRYLEWLAHGRQSIPTDLGYTFLFIYGLERRALCEQFDQAEIFDEVLRLRQLYAKSGEELSRSFDGYTVSFLWFLAAVFPQRIRGNQIEQLAKSVNLWTEESLISMVSWLCQTGTPMPAWAAFAVAESLPQSQRSVVVRRVRDEFEQLFAAKYRAQFEIGLRPIASKRPLRHRYRAASAKVQWAEVPIPNPMGAPSQFKPLAKIWNDSLQELKRLSTVVGKAGTTGDLTAAMWEALPLELRVRTEHPLTDQLNELVEKNTREDGRVYLSITQLAQACSIGSGEKLTATLSKKLCQTLEYAGYGIEPDARLVNKGFKDDQIVSLFLLTTDDQADPVRYLAASCMLRMGMFIAASDDEIHQQEVAVLMQQVKQAFELSPIEHRRLEVLSGLLEQVPPDASSLARMAKTLSPDQRQAAGKLMLALVAADGVITEAELKALRKGFTALELGKSAADAAITSLSANTNDAEELPTVVSGNAAEQKGEAIPAPKPVGLVLNRAAIAAIMNDTQQVAQMLATAMQNDSVDDDISSKSSDTAVLGDSPTAPVQVDPVVVAVAGAPNTITTDDKTLPQRYAAFYRLLIAKVRWELKDAEALARGQGHMLSGAVEALNEWAFEKLGGQLFVEEGESLVVEKELLN